MNFKYFAYMDPFLNKLSGDYIFEARQNITYV